MSKLRTAPASMQTTVWPHWTLPLIASLCWFVVLLGAFLFNSFYQFLRESNLKFNAGQELPAFARAVQEACLTLRNWPWLGLLPLAAVYLTVARLPQKRQGRTAAVLVIVAACLLIAMVWAAMIDPFFAIDPFLALT